MKKVITIMLVLSPTLAFADGITNGIVIAGKRLLPMPVPVLLWYLCQ